MSLRTTLKALAAIGAGALAAKTAYRYLWHIDPPRMHHVKARASQAMIAVGDRVRSYVTYVPPDLKKSAPLLIVLHTSGMTAELMRGATARAFDAAADRAGFAVVYPDGFRKTWNDCRKLAKFPAKRFDIDDVGFVRALVERMATEHQIDPRRVFVFGFGNGGHMCFRLALEHPGLVAAVASVAANLAAPDSTCCESRGPTARIMFVNGTHDRINRYHGGDVSLFMGIGKRGAVLNARESAQEIGARNGALTSSETVRLPRSEASTNRTFVERTTWEHRGEAVSALYTVRGGGHVMPQPYFRFPRMLGRTNVDLNVYDEALEFFGIG